MNTQKKRSGFTVMLRLIGLVKPLAGYMALAILMGLVGHLCASFITIFGGYAVLDLLGFRTPVALTAVFICVLVFALVRGGFRYAEQACNHFIAFKLLALIHDHVFRALRRLCPRQARRARQGRPDLGHHLRYRASGSLLCAHHLPRSHRAAVHGDSLRLYRQLPSAVGMPRAAGVCHGGRDRAPCHLASFQR